MKVAIFGAGTMGSGIAQVFAAKGHTALMYASSPASAQRHKDKLAASLAKRVAKGKMTLMVVKALAEADDSDRARLVEILEDENSSQDDVDEAIDLFNKYGSIEYAHNVALENINGAKEVLEILPDSEAKQQLIDIADFVLERKS